MVSSVVGEKARNRAIPPNGRIMPPKLRSTSLSMTVSHRTEQNMIYKVLFCISMNKKLSARSSMIEEYMLGLVAPDLCRYCREKATKNKRPLAVFTGFPSNLE